MKQYKDNWKLAADAYHATGGFSDGSYLDKYPRESDDKFEERKKVAYYDTAFRQKIQRYVGYLYRQRPVRVSKDKLIRLIFDDADKMGNSADVFFSGFAHDAKVRGAMLLLVDMPKDVPGTLAQQLEDRAVPYFVAIEPERIVSYKIDKFGRFEWIEFGDVIDNSTPKKPDDKKKVTRYYDKEGWKVKDGDEVLDSGTYDIGVCPVIPFSETGKFPAIGEFTQIGELAKRHYNLTSELDEILRAQTFSLLTIQAESPKDVQIDIGTDNAISYGANMERPDFIAPPAAPAETYQKKIKAIEDRINAIAYDTTTSSGAESGISLEIKFQGLNGSLSNFAMRMNDLERRAYAIALRYIKSTKDVEISYPTEFNIVDVEQEVRVLDDVKQLGFHLPTYEAEKLKRIVTTDLGEIPKETKEQIVKEIDDQVKEVTEPS